VNEFAPLVGDWGIEMTHPALPGTVVQGAATFEWLAGERFMIYRSSAEHPDFPEGIALIGVTDDRLTMHSFDSRGVFRVYDTSFEDRVWRIWRDEPGLNQRSEGRLSEDGNTIEVLFQMSEDGSTWTDDLKATYRRVS
jgi:hypothetical protein